MGELSMTHAAMVVGKSREIVWRWIRKGLLPARKLGIGGHYRIKVDDLRRFAAQYEYDFDEELAAKLSGK